MGKSVRERVPKPPAILPLAAHPLRWRLLSELALSDRRVRELTARVDEPQSLVSYHLGRLQVGGLVRSRRSSADGRDAYYRADLATCGALLSSAGQTLHPGLTLTRLPIDGPLTVSGRVLFLCTGNSARSQMAEGLLQHLTAGTVEVFSGGSHPTRLHPNAVRVMRRYGIDLSGRRAKHLDEFAGQPFDYVITLCDRVREVCPEFPSPTRAVHWSMANPAEEGDTNRATLPAFERTAAELDTRIGFLIAMLANKKRAALNG